MQSGKIYRITKRIKLHTKPLYEANVTVIGQCIRESEKCYIFDTFRCKKDNIIEIKEENQTVETA